MRFVLRTGAMLAGLLLAQPIGWAKEPAPVPGETRPAVPVAWLEADIAYKSGADFSAYEKDCCKIFPDIFIRAAP